MIIEKEFYGEASLDETDSLEIQDPIKLKYYKIKNRRLEEEKCSYGIEIVKEQRNHLEVKKESEEIGSIYKDEKQLIEVLEKLRENKVTPIELKDIIRDMYFQDRI